MGSKINSSFIDFKGIHADKSAVILATGPSLDKFSLDLLPEKDGELVTLGVTMGAYHPTLKFDYYFCGHAYGGLSGGGKIADREKKLGASLMDKVLELKSSKRIKHVFCCTKIQGKHHPAHFSADDSNKMGAIQFEQHHQSGAGQFHVKIHDNPVYGHNIIYSPLQFALYAGCKKVYIVGCDGPGTMSSFLDNERAYPVNKEHFFQHWKFFRKFVRSKYPDVRIVNVNPLALKGFFDEDIFADNQ